MIELCLFERDAPKTAMWAKDAISRGGLAAGSNVGMIKYLQERCDGRLISLASRNDFLVIGAWLEHCVGYLTNDLLHIYDARSVSILLPKTYSVEEKVNQKFTGTQLSTSRKRSILMESHPALLQLGDRLNIHE